MEDSVSTATLEAILDHGTRTGHTANRRSRPAVPGSTVSLLTETSKMPGRSWSLPAHRACPGAVTKPAIDGRPAICGSCYAAKGAYLWRSTQAAQWERFNWARQCMRSPEGLEEFLAT